MFGFQILTHLTSPEDYIDYRDVLIRQKFVIDRPRPHEGGGGLG